MFSSMAQSELCHVNFSDTLSVISLIGQYKFTFSCDKAVCLMRHVNCPLGRALCTVTGKMCPLDGRICQECGAVAPTLSYMLLRRWLGHASRVGCYSNNFTVGRYTTAGVRVPCAHRLQCVVGCPGGQSCEQ